MGVKIPLGAQMIYETVLSCWKSDQLSNTLNETEFQYQRFSTAPIVEPTLLKGQSQKMTNIAERSC
jgi:hypothetical protein